jgi:hypothetical protein
MLAASAAVLACCMPAQAAKVEMALRIQTAANEEVEPVAPGVWNVPLGYEFKVVLSAYVSEPNFATTGPPNNRATYPLGLNNMSIKLLTGGVQVIDPLTNPPHSPELPPRWRYQDLSTVGAPWVNVFDYDLDGDLDPVGAGFADLNIVGGQPSRDNPDLQMGLDGFFDFGRGQYIAANVGTTSLATDSIDRTIGIPLSSVLVLRYGDNVAGDGPMLIPERAVATDAVITINVVDTADGWDGARNVSVPEPAALPAVGAVTLLGLLRRRKARG